jgi:hypothetical protein
LLVSGQVRGRSSLSASFIGLPFVLISATAINIFNFYIFWAIIGLALAGLRVMSRAKLPITVGTAHLGGNESLEPQLHPRT